MRHPFLIVSGRPTSSTFSFADELARIYPDRVLIVSDMKPDQRPNIAGLIHIDDEEARSAGYVNSSPLIKKTPIAWDKALYALSAGEYAGMEHVWIIEDDVLFASPELANQLAASYRRSEMDLLAPNFFRFSENPEWDHWGTADMFAPEHRAGGFVALARFSRAMIDHCHAFVHQHGSLGFIESMFPSLLLQHGLKFEKLGFLKERTFRWKPAFRKWELMLKLDDSLESGIFHPVKAERLRALTARASKRFRWSNPSTWDLLLR